MSSLRLPDLDEFMWRVRRRMTEYNVRTGRYADEWFLLGIRFWGHRGNNKIDFQSYEAKPSDGARWRPPKSMETYVIRRASETGFLVEAIEPDGAVVAVLDESMDEARRLKDSNCNWEYEDLFVHDPGRPTEREVLEPLSEEHRATKFLIIAQDNMKKYRKAHGDYPRSWEELGMHWAEIKHSEKDPSALPPPGTGASWRPLGSSLTYTMMRMSSRHFQLEARDDGGQVKNACDATTRPEWSPGPEITK